MELTRTVSSLWDNSLSTNTLCAYNIGMTTYKKFLSTKIIQSANVAIPAISEDLLIYFIMQSKLYADMVDGGVLIWPGF